MSAPMAGARIPAHETGGSPTCHLGLLLCNDVEEVDAVGASEVLSYWTLHHVNAPDHQGAPVPAHKTTPPLPARRGFMSAVPADVRGPHGR